MGTLFPAGRDCDKGSDRISELPDDILMKFVSRMGMKDAAKTSILSKQWRYLWAKSTHLDFDHLIVLPDVEYICYPPPAIKNKYINWVNQVVDLHCSPCINTFRLCFSFQSDDAHRIDKWVRFAISKQVKNLELDLSYSRQVVYALTFDVLKPSIDVNDSGIRFLQSLYLDYINVSGDILEYLLVQCRLLERLHVESSETLVRLKVVGSCLKLKHLTILQCWNLEEVDIEAVNLVYLRCNSTSVALYRSNTVFKSILILVEARFDATRVSDFARFFQQNSHLARISKLSLAMECCENSAGNLPTFSNLKQLTIMVDGATNFEVAPINQILKACPKLREFKLEFGHWDDRLLEAAYERNELNSPIDDVGIEITRDWECFESMFEMEIDPTGLPNLKEFQIAGFYGWNVDDVDLILFLVLIACNLETIVCDCSSHRDTVIREASRSRAAKLAKLIPPKISFAIM